MGTIEFCIHTYNGRRYFTNFRSQDPGKSLAVSILVFTFAVDVFLIKSCDPDTIATANEVENSGTNNWDENVKKQSRSIP